MYLMTTRQRGYNIEHTLELYCMEGGDRSAVGLCTERL